MEHHEEAKTIETLLAAGDERCMNLLFAEYYRDLCAYAARYPLSAESVEDIVQNVFISFWENKRGRPFVGSVRSYLFGAVSKAALRWLRDEGKAYFEDIETHVDDFWESMFNREEEEAFEKLMEKLREAVEQLAEQPKRVVRSIIWEDKPYKLVAQEMGISVNSVKTYYVRALESLRKMLGDKYLILLILLSRKKV